MDDNDDMTRDKEEIEYFRQRVTSLEARLEEVGRSVISRGKIFCFKVVRSFVCFVFVFPILFLYLGRPF
jgi:hypothetical protein